MAERSQELLKPTMVVTGPNDPTIVKDVYEQEGVLDKINNYVEKSPTLGMAEKYVSNLSDEATGVLGDIGKLGENFTPNADGVRNLLKGTKGIQERIKGVLNSGYGSIEQLSDNLKTSLIGEVVNQVGINPQIEDVYQAWQNGDFDDMSVGDYASTIIGAAAEVNGIDASGMLVQIDGIQKLVNCDPSDLKSMQSILEDMTGNGNLFGIIDTSALTGTLSTVLRFANDWGLPQLAKHAIDKIDDYELKLKSLKSAAISASLHGDVGLTKFYTDELDDKANNIPGTIMGMSKYSVGTIAHQLCDNLISHYRIPSDNDKTMGELGNELISYLDYLDVGWMEVGAKYTDFNALSRASKDALRVLVYTKYAAPASIAQYCKQEPVDNTIRRTFPQLLDW